MPFPALVLDPEAGGPFAAVRSLEEDDLPEGEVLLSVLYSSLNYKDALAVTNRGKIVRGDYPFVPGIDLVGRVEASASADWREGDVVVGTGGGLGENRWGGYSRRQRVDGRLLVALPEGMAPQDAMVVGTAGFTAMLAVMALEQGGVTPERGPVVATGASGGVGSMAVALLDAHGYEVVASTGTEAAHDYLRRLGAGRIVPRGELGGGPRRPMETARWAGAVDAVGGDTLAALIAQTGWHGCIAACGLAGGAELHTTVFPFILRGVRLWGIDSNTSPPAERRTAWERLARTLGRAQLDAMTAEVIPLHRVPAASEALLDHGVMGRVVVDLGKAG